MGEAKTGPAPSVPDGRGRTGLEQDSLEQDSLERDGLAYTPFFCEENIWHLAGDPRLSAGKAWIAFISNPSRTVAMWSQRAAPGPEVPMVWDYHVILLTVLEPGAEPSVFDLDTVLGLPTPLETYLSASFHFTASLDRSLRPLFRVVEAPLARRTFSSDRSHMRRGGTFVSPPPAWPLIQAPGTTMNLDRFLDMDRDFVGQVSTLSDLRQRFSCRS